MPWGSLKSEPLGLLNSKERVGSREGGCVDGDVERYFVLGKHEPPGTKETFELMEGSIVLEERGPFVESQSQTQSEGEVGDRGQRRV